MSKRYIFEPQAPGTSPEQRAAWREQHLTPLDLDEEAEHVLAYIAAIQAIAEWDREDSYNQVTRQMGREGRPTYGKAQLRRAYRRLIERGVVARDSVVMRRIRLKPIRTASGIMPISVMVKPYPCPGKCIFCPTDVRMPKSYLSDEPAGQRAISLQYDPYRQVEQRLQAMRNIGHTVDKVELIVLGGTFGSYPPDYEEWFIRRTFDALNGTDATTLAEAHQRNETAGHRCTGLVVETRPDHITPAELRRLRQLGVTRVQIGVQSLDDRVLALNKRGHTADEVHEAVRLLRGAGFKITLHWMPNLLGATPESDVADFARFWATLHPDEMKIYPTGLLEGTELYDHYERGDYRPYTEAELTEVLMACKRMVPVYCRLNRVMRDIPEPDIADGVTRSNLRQIVQHKLKQAGTPCRCIRCREVRHEPIEAEAVQLDAITYDTSHSREIFLQAVTLDDRLAGFLRLSLPTAPTPLPEIDGHAMIRQVQVYGPSVPIGDERAGRAQHQGLGTRLIERAFALAQQAGFDRVAVIAAVGTRDYYRRFGFTIEGDYMQREL